MTFGHVVSGVLQVIVVFLFVAGVATFLTLMKGYAVLRGYRQSKLRDYGDILLKSPLVPQVSLIAVPPDVSQESRDFTRRLLDIIFASHELVIVLDGPSELELETWSREYHLVPSARQVDSRLTCARIRGVYESRDPLRVVVVDKDRGGHADSLNAGLNAASSPLIGVIDPATEFSPNLLLRMIGPILEAPRETLAVCGVTPAPVTEGSAARVGALESLRAWLGRAAASAGRDTMTPIPGTAVLAQRDAIAGAGGFSGSLMELILRMHAFARSEKRDYRISFLPEPVSHIRTPETRAELHRIASRDQREIAIAWDCRKKLKAPLGWKVLPGLYATRFVRPLVETIAIELALVGLVMGWVDWALALLVVMSTAVMGTLLSMSTVILGQLADPDGDPASLAALFFASIPENFGYRQMRNLWLIMGFRKTAPEEQNRGRTAASRPVAVPVSAKNII